MTSVVVAMGIVAVGLVTAWQVMQRPIPQKIDADRLPASVEELLRIGTTGSIAAYLLSGDPADPRYLKLSIIPEGLLLFGKVGSVDPDCLIAAARQTRPQGDFGEIQVGANIVGIVLESEAEAAAGLLGNALEACFGWDRGPVYTVFEGPYARPS